MPWDHFTNWNGITVWRLVVVGILVMILRRLPWVVVLVSPPVDFAWTMLILPVEVDPMSSHMARGYLRRLFWSNR
jgi:hypothetical protein